MSDTSATLQAPMDFQRPRAVKLKRFLRSKRAMIGLIIILVEVFLVTAGLKIYGIDPNALDILKINAAPEAGHILGFDNAGRDMLARVLEGGRISILIGVCAALLGTVIGVAMGLLAGYFQGFVGSFIMRFSDIFLSFPLTVLALVVVSVFEPTVLVLIITIGCIQWVSTCKLIYGNVVMLRDKEFVLAEKALGSSDAKIMFREILPNAMAPVWANTSFHIVSAILLESTLSFLGCGIKIPQASWGNIIYEARSIRVLTDLPWMWIPAGIFLVITIVAFTLLGEGLRDVFDPKTQTE